MIFASWITVLSIAAHLKIVGGAALATYYDVSAPAVTTRSFTIEDHAQTIVRPLGPGSANGVTRYEEKIIHTSVVRHYSTETFTEGSGFVPYTEFRTVEQGASTLAFDQPPAVLDVGQGPFGPNKLITDGLRRNCQLDLEKKTGVCVEVEMVPDGTVQLINASTLTTTIIPTPTPHATRTYTGPLVAIATITELPSPTTSSGCAGWRNSANGFGGLASWVAGVGLVVYTL